MLAPAGRLPRLCAGLKGLGLTRLQRIVEADKREPLTRALSDDGLQPGDALVPPVAKELGVKRTDHEPSAGQALAVIAQPRNRARDELGGVGVRDRLRTFVVVRAAVDRPGAVVMDGSPVVVAVATVGWIARTAPDNIDRSPIDWHEHHARLADQRSQVRAVAEAEALSQLHAGATHAGAGEQGLQVGRMRALWQPEATAPSRAETRPLGVDAGLHLRAHERIAAHQGQDRVGRRRGPACVWRKRSQQVITAGRQHLNGALVVAG